MGKLRWYKRETGAALSGMMELSLEERGAYNTILDLIYDRDGDLPDDDRFISGWLRCDVRVWRRIRARLIDLKKLIVEDGKITNLRATSEIDRALCKYGSVQELNRVKGIKSGAVRRKNNKLAEPNSNRARTEVEIEIDSVSKDTERDTTSVAVEIFNAVAERTGWPQVRTLTQQRRTHLESRLSDCGGIDGWSDAIERAARSDFLTGKIPRGDGHQNWSPDFDFFLQPKTFTRLIEGSYDNRTHPNNHHRAGTSISGALASVIAKIDRAGGYAGEGEACGHESGSNVRLLSQRRSRQS